MTTPTEPRKLRLEFDVEPTASGYAQVAAALEASYWTATVLSEPALLFLEDVARSLAELQNFVRRMTQYGESRDFTVFAKKSPINSELSEHVDEILSFLDADGLRRPSFMGDIAWQITEQIADSMRSLSRALHAEDDETIRRLFLPPPPGEITGHADWTSRLSPPEGAQLLLDQLRHELDPKITEMRSGSVIATVITVGGPVILPIIGVLTARSIIKKNNSEAAKARADAAKSGAEARLADSQRIKVIAEAEKVRAETAEVHLNLIKSVIDQRQSLTWEAQDAIVAMLLDLESRSNASIDGPFANTARQVITENLHALIFLAQRVKEVEGEDD